MVNLSSKELAENFAKDLLIRFPFDSLKDLNGIRWDFNKLAIETIVNQLEIILLRKYEQGFIAGKNK